MGLLETRAARIESVLRRRLPIPCRIETANLTATLDDAWVRETAARIASIKMGRTLAPEDFDA